MQLNQSIRLAEGLVEKFDAERNFSSAWSAFQPTILQIMSHNDVSNVMELGAGRSPSFDRETLEKLGITYCSNDISQRELDLGPSWTRKACFDLCSKNSQDIAAFAGSSDVIFSKMLMEHVGDYRAAYCNIAQILRPGGISISFHPVLFSVPFIANRLMPERLSALILESVFPDRNDAQTPKFPALYSGCRISQSVRASIKAQGFSAVWQIPFWGHGYYKKFPIVRDIHAKSSAIVQRAGLTAFATYSITVAVK